MSHLESPWRRGQSVPLGVVFFFLLGMVVSRCVPSSRCTAESRCSSETIRSCDEVVEAPAGRFKGTPDTPETCAYLGIPYALSTEGKHRFQPPKPHPRVMGEFYARGTGSVCAQIMSFRSQFILPPAGNENCLSLNIYQPRSRDGEPYPVMVFIHGGAFTVGSGSWPQYRGSYLARQGVVVVTLNYRLGPLGFLALPELKEEDPRGSYGNYGILDQILALRWVHENIAAFGGDPNRITIFGESAGGMSVCTLFALPEARPYFRRGIIHSGGCTAVGEEQRSFAQGITFAERVGCREPGPARLQCLRSLPLDELLLRGHPDVIWDGFQPRIDGVLLRTTPLEILKAGEAQDKELLAGANADELMLGIIVNPPTLKYKFLPWEQFWRRIGEIWGEERATHLQRLYPQEKYSDPVSLWEDILGDVVLRCPTDLALRAQNRFQERVYSYYFTWNYTFTRTDTLQAFHGYDLAFIFGVFDAWGGIFGEKLKEALALRDTMQRYWVRFAATGDPNGGEDPPWIPYREGKTQYLGSTVFSHDNPLKDRCSYWEPYLPQGIDGLTQGVWDLGER